MTSYFFDKSFLLKDLKDKNFEIINTDIDYSPFGIKKYGTCVWVVDDYIKGKRPKNDDEFVIDELEGHCWGGGLRIVVEICNKLGLKFITDEELQLAYSIDKEITAENFGEFEENCLRNFHLKRNEEGLIVLDETYKGYTDEDDDEEDKPLPPRVKPKCNEDDLPF